MAESLDDYFARVNPIHPSSASEPLGPPAPDLQLALDKLTKQWFGSMPTQLDRARSFRNRFIQAVQ